MNGDDDDVDTLSTAFSRVSVKPYKKKVNYIKSLLAGYPNLKLDAYKIYNSSAIVKEGEWNQFKESVITFLENKQNEYTLSHPSGVPKSSGVQKSSRLPKSSRPPVSSTSIEPSIHKGGKKSRRNTRRRKYSKNIIQFIL